MKRSKKETYITLVLDRSTSMHSCYDAALSAINEQIDTIKKNARKGGKTYVSVILFDNVVEIVRENVPAEQLRHLTLEDYVLQGCTALRDAVKTAIEVMEERKDGDINQGFLVVLVSDGQENSSGTPASEFKSKIAELEASDRWTFTYMLDGHTWEDVQQMTQVFGSSVGNYLTYTSNDAGTRDASPVLRSAIVNYMADRSSGKTSKKNFYHSGTDGEHKVS